MSDRTPRRLLLAAGVLLFAAPAALAEPATLEEAARQAAAAADAAAPDTATDDAKADASVMDEKSSEIWEKYLDAVGGREKLESIKSRTDTLALTIPAMGLNGSATAYSTADGKVAMVLDMPMMGKIQQGFDGEHGWIIDPINGAQLMGDEMMAEMRRDSSLEGMFHPERVYSKISYAGQEEFNGTTAHALTFVDQNGDTQTRYFHPESGQMIGTKGKSTTEMGELEITSTYSDFKEFNGFTFPGKMIQSFGPVEQVMEFKSIEFNSVDPAVFAMPEAIKVLVKQKTDADKPDADSHDGHDHP